MKIGDLVKLSSNAYEPEICTVWGLGIVLNLSAEFGTASVWWFKRDVERVFAFRVLEVI